MLFANMNQVAVIVLTFQPICCLAMMISPKITLRLILKITLRFILNDKFHFHEAQVESLMGDWPTPISANMDGVFSSESRGFHVE